MKGSDVSRALDRAGFPLRPLVLGPDLIPTDESIIGLLVRVTSLNGFASPIDVLRIADSEVPAITSLSGLDDAQAERLAYVMNIPAGELLFRRHGRLGTNYLGGWRNFFGVAIRRVALDWKARRVSPRALG